MSAIVAVVRGQDFGIDRFAKMGADDTTSQSPDNRTDNCTGQYASWTDNQTNAGPNTGTTSGTERAADGTRRRANGTTNLLGIVLLLSGDRAATWACF